MDKQRLAANKFANTTPLHPKRTTIRSVISGLHFETPEQNTQHFVVKVRNTQPEQAFLVVTLPVHTTRHLCNSRNTSQSHFVPFANHTTKVRNT